jgi:hypothetical protein
MEPLLILLGLAFAANKIVSTIKNLTTAETRGSAVTQVVVWAAAFGMLLLAGEASVTEGLIVPGLSEPLGELDFPSFVVLGLIAGSTGSVVYDFKKAIDNTDSAGEPALFKNDVPDGG